MKLDKFWFEFRVKWAGY